MGARGFSEEAERAIRAEEDCEELDGLEPVTLLHMAFEMIDDLRGELRECRAALRIEEMAGKYRQDILRRIGEAVEASRVVPADLLLDARDKERQCDSRLEDA